PQSAPAHQPRAEGQFRSVALPPLRLLQPRAAAHRDAPRQLGRAEGSGARKDLRFPARRNHSYREQLQVHDRFLSCARGRHRLVARRGLDRPGAAFFRACLDAALTENPSLWFGAVGWAKSPARAVMPARTLLAILPTRKTTAAVRTRGHLRPRGRTRGEAG